jgi:hypothetical protein
MTRDPAADLALERDQLSRDASDARRQLGIARATVVRLWAELQDCKQRKEHVMATLYRGKSRHEPHRSRPRLGRRFVELWLRGRYIGVAW